MSVNWITLLAQLLNFAVLVLILQRFLYRPILKAISRREKEIQSRLDTAERARQDADAERKALVDAQDRFAAEKDDLLETARLEAGELEARLAAEARSVAKIANDMMRASVQAEKDLLLKDATKTAGIQFGRIVSAALNDLVGIELEPRLAEQWLTSLKSASTSQSATLQALLSSGEVQITSCHPLPKATRCKLEAGLAGLASREVAINYETSGHGSAGLQILIGKKTFDWSLDHYLEQFEKDLKRELELEAVGRFEECAAC